MTRNLRPATSSEVLEAMSEHDGTTPTQLLTLLGDLSKHGLILAKKLEPTTKIASAPRRIEDGPWL